MLAERFFAHGSSVWCSSCRGKAAVCQHQRAPMPSIPGDVAADAHFHRLIESAPRSPAPYLC